MSLNWWISGKSFFSKILHRERGHSFDVNLFVFFLDAQEMFFCVGELVAACKAWGGEFEEQVVDWFGGGGDDGSVRNSKDNRELKVERIFFVC